VHLRAAGGGSIRRERQAARRDAFGQELLQTGLEERRLTLCKRLDLAGIDISWPMDAIAAACTAPR